MKYTSYPLKPTWEPANAAAEQTLRAVRSLIPNYPATPASRRKHDLFLAGFLVMAQKALGSEDRYIAIPQGKSYWTPFEVGGTEARKATKLLEEAGLITKKRDTGYHKEAWVEGSNNKWVKKTEGIVSLYDVDPRLATDVEGFVDAVWIESKRPTVQVGVEEDYWDRKRRKEQKKAKPKINPRIMGAAYSQAHRDVLTINNFMREHPLQMPANSSGVRPLAASVTRTFHNERITEGGRFYGLWTNTSSDYRLMSQIDGEEVVEIDLNASQPTLFSTLLGVPMLDGQVEWYDLYEEVLKQIERVPSISTVEDDLELKRKKLKQVATECIGTGNPRRSGPAKDSEIKFHVAETMFEQSEYSVYRTLLMQAVPALQQLNKETRYTGPAFLSYHESEIMRLTLLELIKLNVPAYPIHDCVLVKKSDKDLAIDTYRQIIREYVLKHSSNLNPSSPTKVFTAPVSVEEHGQEKVRLVGGYF